MLVWQASRDVHVELVPGCMKFDVAAQHELIAFENAGFATQA